MADNLGARVLDFGLNVLDTEADKIYLCSQEPTTYAEASSTYALGVKDQGAGGVFGVPGAGTPNGRKVDSNAISDGSITGDGTATKWAVVDSANNRLLACGSLSAPQAVTTGNTFSLPSFTIRIPNQ